MRAPLSSSLLSALALALSLACSTTPSSSSSSSSSGPADRVLLGRVWTGDAQAPWAGGVAIRGGVVVGVGSEDDLRAFMTEGNTTRVAGLVTPGLIDAHVHPLGAGRQEQGCSLQGAATIEALTARIRACHEASADKTGILFGRGWNLSLFADANPQRGVLDAIVGERPAYFRGEDGHSGWANSAMLRLAKIDKTTKNPEHGVIEHDKDGAPSGTLREDAIELVESLLPQPTLADDVRALRWAVNQLSANGITSIMDAGLDEERLAAWAALAKEGPLAVDVVGCVVVDPNAAPGAVGAKNDDGGDVGLDEAVALRARFAGVPRLRVGCAKIFLDGVLEGETAALLAPYTDHPEHSGTLTTSPAQLAPFVTALEARDFQVHMHVIGDAGVRAALDAFAAARAAHGDKDLRNTLAHLQLVDAADDGRFAALGVIANAQSYWAYPDTYILDINLPQVGQARVDAMYPWGSLRRAGARLVGGSDWPVSTVNPLDALETMVRRQDPAKSEGPVLGKNEFLDVDAGLAAYTRDGAFLLHREADLGVLRVGAAADVVVFDRDFVKGAAADINAAHVVLTLKGGVVVFAAPTAP